MRTGAALPALLLLAGLAACAGRSGSTVSAASPEAAGEKASADSAKVESEDQFTSDRWRWYANSKGMSGAGVVADRGQSLLALECVTRGSQKILYVAIWAMPPVDAAGRTLLISYDDGPLSAQSAESLPQGFSITQLEPGFVAVVDGLRAHNSLLAVTNKNGKEVRRQTFTLRDADAMVRHPLDACGW